MALWDPMYRIEFFIRVAVGTHQRFRDVRGIYTSVTIRSPRFGVER